MQSEKRKKKIFGFQHKPIYPSSFKFISNIQINRDRGSKAYITFGKYTYVLASVSHFVPQCRIPQIVLRRVWQLKIVS